MRNTSQC